MNRREFMKGAAALAAFAAVPGALAAELAAAAKVTRRTFKDTATTVPLLGFGMMRLPTKPKSREIDRPAAQALVDRAMSAGLNYFDTAWMYCNGKSEEFVGEALKKYPRASYLVASKLPIGGLRTAGDIERTFNEQLRRCNVGYFDFYMLHNLNARSFANAEKLKAYEWLLEQKKQGKIRQLGFSVHDTPEVLQTIVAAHPWDFAQIQLNYLDWDLYRSREQYEILTARKIPVIVMEPLRGGSLAKLTPGAEAVLKKRAPDASIASWGLRYAASLPNVLLVLSGMNQMAHLDENIGTFTGFRPLSTEEQTTLREARTVYLHTQKGSVPCTACRYCSCPHKLDIPALFAIWNNYCRNRNVKELKRRIAQMPPKVRPKGCVGCRVCVRACPQKIDIPAEFKRINAEIAKLK